MLHPTRIFPLFFSLAWISDKLAGDLMQGQLRACNIAP